MYVIEVKLLLLSGMYMLLSKVFLIILVTNILRGALQQSVLLVWFTC